VIPLTLFQEVDVALDDWKTLLLPKDLLLLSEIRALGADLIWRKKELSSDSGRAVVHYSAVVAFRGSKHVIASSGPADLRFRDRNQMILRLVRSALHQADFKLRQNKLAH